ncbi:MAG: hypothetical protein ABJA49_01930 [Betaproteobacteria bacterium]
MATQLIDEMSGNFDPAVFSEEFRDSVMKLIKHKVGQQARGDQKEGRMKADPLSRYKAKGNFGATPALRKCRLKFALYGHKLRGRWTLGRIGRGAESDVKAQWLLIKELDDCVRRSEDYDVLEAHPDSVANVGDAAKAALAAAPKAPLPRIGGFTQPQGSRVALGALLLGVYGDDGRLHYGRGATTASAWSGMRYRPLH